MTKILIVDDEPVVSSLLNNALSRQNFAVTVVENGEQALNAIRMESFDLVILDLGLPDQDGLLVCRSLRQESAIPIIVLTARDREVDKVLGLDQGADDYVTKPFSVLELMARVRAALRRSEIAAVKDEETITRFLRHGELEIDILSHQARLKGVPIELTPKEFDLLAFLMEHRGEAFSREQLLTAVWKYEQAVETRTVVVHIGWLRQKIEADPSRPCMIETVRGVGYRFRNGRDEFSIAPS